MEQKSNKTQTALLIVFMLTTIFLSAFIVYDKFLLTNKTEPQNNNSTETTKEYINTFKTYENLYPTESFGKVLVKGYATIEKIKDVCYSEEECANAKLFDYVMFNIVETDSQEFKDYINKRIGNSYFMENAVGLGCLENNIISYQNYSTEYGYKSYKLNEINSQKIINSSKDNPITLYLERLPLISGGAGASTCYSFISNIEIVK